MEKSRIRIRNTDFTQFSILLSAEEEDVRKKRKLSGGDGGEETPSKAARTEAVHPEPENRVPLPAHPSGTGTSPAGYSCAFVCGCNNVRYCIEKGTLYGATSSLFIVLLFFVISQILEAVFLNFYRAKESIPPVTLWPGGLVRRPYSCRGCLPP